MENNTYKLTYIEGDKWKININYKANMEMRDIELEMDFLDLLKLTDVLSWCGFADISKGRY